MNKTLPGYRVVVSQGVELRREQGRQNRGRGTKDKEVIKDMPPHSSCQLGRTTGDT